ncbi:MAG: hypothetical protein AB7O66_23755 [Limisphaerales bacterium]
MLSVIAGLPAGALVLLNASGHVTGISGLHVVGGGLNGTFDVRFAADGLVTALTSTPELLPLYDNPSLGEAAALSVAASISQVLTDAERPLIDDGGSGSSFFSVPYGSIDGPDPSLSRFAHAYDENSPGFPPDWVVSGSVELSNYFLGPYVLMSAAIPEITATAAITGAVLAFFVWGRLIQRHRRERE